MTLEELHAAIDGIKAAYEDDNEVGHSQEDDLLWAYVREMAEDGDLYAVVLTELDDHDRTRWYA